MQWYHVILALLGLYLLTVIWALATLYLQVRKSGFPLVVVPTNPDNPFWIVAGVPLRPLLPRWLPANLRDRITVTTYGWEFAARYKIHSKFGQSFVIVTPGRNELWTADPDLATAILARRKDFHQPEVTRRKSPSGFARSKS